MNELQVVVQQTPGQISWNYEDLKNELGNQMKKYKGMVYTDDDIPVARKDLASLRKLEKSVDEKKKEIKKKCLEPYEEVEAQAKELMGLIREPIDLIDSQVKGYEKEQKEKKKKEILQFMDKTFSSLPDDIAGKLKEKIYDSRWENTSATKKSWTQAIKDACQKTEDDLNILSDVDDDFMDAAYSAYLENLEMTDAMKKVQELQKQREIVLENQRRREEEKRRQEEMRRQMEEQRSTAPPVQNEPEPPKAQPQGNPMPRPERTAQAAAQQPQAEASGKAMVMVRLSGTREQINKVFAYAKYVGADMSRVD